ncbi:hypothetical protein BOO71_0011737 [Deinococcus marmoris]|uniref:Uncharacterized protein n=1 Tax=Deinococcus marmoris TaxID=249408 RepID=A0A1U7NU90_9DEIO|nr:hypothetical protein BOO71_0011737 [Deinococcus marmoris]
MTPFKKLLQAQIPVPGGLFNRYPHPREFASGIQSGCGERDSIRRMSADL